MLSKKHALIRIAALALSASGALRAGKGPGGRRQLVELPGRALEDRRGRDQGRDREGRRQVYLRRRATSPAKQLTDIDSLIARGAKALIVLAQDTDADRARP